MKFIEFLQDPVNGIFTLIGAVILSMFGAFIKDGILKLFSHSSKWFKEKREKDILERDIIVEQLVNSQPYLILYCAKTILSNVTVVLTYLILIAVPTYIKITTPSELTIPATETNIGLTGLSIPVGNIIQICVLIFLLICSIIGLCLIYSVSKRNLIIMLATKMIQATFKGPSTANVASSGGNIVPQSKPEITLVTTSRSDPIVKNTKNNDTSGDKQKNNALITKRIDKNGKVFVARNGVLYTVIKPENPNDKDETQN